jgi:hypothetical protein
MIDVEAGNVKMSVREVMRGLMVMGTVVVALCGFIWGVSAWKAGVENHLGKIDQHMDDQDKKLLWIMENMRRRDEQEAQPQSLPQKRPRGRAMLYPNFSQLSSPQQDAGIPTNP